MNVKSTFLNRYLEEKVYIEQPLCYIVKGHGNYVLKLKKALYMLEQAPRAWYNKIDKYFQTNNFIKYPFEHALYAKVNRKRYILIVCLNDYDLILI